MIRGQAREIVFNYFHGSEPNIQITQLQDVKMYSTGAQGNVERVLYETTKFERNVVPTLVSPKKSYKQKETCVL